MKILIRRILALALISLGVSMVFLPFNNSRSGSKESEIVTIEQLEYYDLDIVKDTFPDMEIVDITGSELNPDDYPDLWDKLIDLVHYDSQNEYGIANEWEDFQSVFFGEIIASRLIIFQEGLISCSVSKEEEAAHKVVHFNYLGKYNPYIKELSESDLSKYPEILQIVKSMDKGVEIDYESSELAKFNWDQLVDDYLDPINDLQTFKFKENFYGPSFGWDVIYKSGEVTGIQSTLKIIGITFFMIGIFLIKMLYFRKRGIMINPPRIAILFDLITLLFAIPSAYMIVNTVLKMTMFIAPITDETFIVFMGNFFFIVGIPVVAYYTGRFTSQSVQINEKGIFVDSLISKKSIEWDALNSISFSDEYIIVARVGLTTPRQLQKCLKLEGKNKESIIINEPQLKSVKKKIFLAFERFTPKHLKEKIDQTLGNW